MTTMETLASIIAYACVWKCAKWIDWQGNRGRQRKRVRVSQQRLLPLWCHGDAVHCISSSHWSSDRDGQTERQGNERDHRGSEEAGGGQRVGSVGSSRGHGDKPPSWWSCPALGHRVVCPSVRTQGCQGYQGAITQGGRGGAGVVMARAAITLKQVLWNKDV